MHIHRAKRTSTFRNHSEKEMYLKNRNGLHCVQVFNRKDVVETEQVSLDKRQLVFTHGTTVYIDTDPPSVHSSTTSDDSSVDVKRDDNDRHIIHAVYKNHSEVPLSERTSGPEAEE